MTRGVHRSILAYIHHRLWDFTSDQDIALFETATTLFQNLIVHFSTVNLSEPFESNFTSELLRLPCLEGLDEEIFDTATFCVLPYLRDPRFQTAVLEHRQLPLLWSVIEKAASIPPAFRNSDLGTNIAGIESQLSIDLTDISSLPSFAGHLGADYAFIRTLCSRCVLTENTTDTPTVAVTACILLGNYVLASPNAASEVSGKIDLPSLFDLISLHAYGRSRSRSISTSSSDQITAYSSPSGVPGPGSADASNGSPAYLHAAAGLLRHLSRSPSVRNTHFLTPASTGAKARQAALALSQYSHTAVQVQGLRLFRGLIADDTEGLVSCVKNGYLGVVMRVWHEAGTRAEGKARAEAEGVKLEVGRGIVAMLKGLLQLQGEHKERKETSEAEEVVATVLGTSDLVDALVFMAGQAGAEKETTMALARAEGYFGFVLLKKLGPRGTEMVVDALKRDDTWGLLSEQVKSRDQDPVMSSGTTPQMPAIEKLNVGDSQAATTATQSGSTDRARDNAVALVVDLIRDSGLDDASREKLAGLLKDNDIFLGNGF